MNTELNTEALAFGASAAAALERAGGDALAAGLLAEPQATDESVVRALAPLGAFDLNLTDDGELEAACALLEVSGRAGVSFPLSARVAGIRSEVEGLVLAGTSGLIGLGGLNGTWRVATLDGRCFDVVASSGTSMNPKDRRIVMATEATPAPPCDEHTLACGLLLECWGLLGSMSRALELTCSYAQARQQFGQSLARFQSVQFALADAEVERAGIAELARYATWSVEQRRDDEIADVLALRLGTLEAGRAIFRVAHQIHGAIGFCDETFLSWLSRNAEVSLSLPFGLSGTAQALSVEMGATPLSGLFTPEEAWR